MVISLRKLRNKLVNCKNECEKYLSELVKREVKIKGEVNKIVITTGEALEEPLREIVYGEGKILKAQQVLLQIRDSETNMTTYINLSP